MGFPLRVFPVGLQSLVAELANALPKSQRRLDREWLENVREFTEIRRQMRGTFLESLAAGIAPERLVLREAEIHVSLLMSASRARSVTVSFRLLGLGYLRRYAGAQVTECRIECTLRQTPAGPANEAGG